MQQQPHHVVVIFREILKELTDWPIPVDRQRCSPDWVWQACSIITT